jgi:hypothetical protein
MFTSMRLLFCVSSFMFLAIWWAAKALFTILACIWLHSCLNSFTLLLSWWLIKELATMLAFVCKKKKQLNFTSQPR